MAALKDEEERLRILMRKIDSEILRFKDLLDKAREKQEDVEGAITEAGLHGIAVNVKPDSETGADLVSELSQHLLNLNKQKNFISAKLDAVIKEEELFGELRKKFGDKVKMNKLGSGDFEIEFSDSETKEIFEKLKKSKTELEGVKKVVQDMEKK